MENSIDEWFDNDDYVEYGKDIVGYPDEVEEVSYWDGHDRETWFEDMLNNQKGFMALINTDEILENFVTQIDEL